MAYTRIKEWIAAEILTAANLNTEFSGCITNENDLDIRLIAEVATRTTLESEHDTLTTNLWNAGDIQVADNRVGQDSMKDSAIHTAELKTGAVTDNKVATANKDGAAATACMRTLGDGAAQACGGADSRLIARSETFTSSDSFTAKSTHARIEMLGAGGGGGGGGSGSGGGCGDGGGGGAYTDKLYETFEVGEAYTVTIGAAGTGGAGGTTGGAGGAGIAGDTTSVIKTVGGATIATEPGGGGGGSGKDNNGSGGGSAGAGGVASGYPGKSGTAGTEGEDYGDGNKGGTGGKAIHLFGDTNAAGGLSHSGTGYAGTAGSGLGAAGGGGGGGSSTGGAGGAGTAGWMRIIW